MGLSHWLADYPVSLNQTPLVRAPKIALRPSVYLLEVCHLSSGVHLSAFVVHQPSPAADGEPRIDTNEYQSVAVKCNAVINR